MIWTHVMVGSGNPLQYSCLKNSMDRGAWRPTVLGSAKESDTTERLTQWIKGCDCIKRLWLRILRFFIFWDTKAISSSFHPFSKALQSEEHAVRIIQGMLLYVPFTRCHQNSSIGRTIFLRKDLGSKDPVLHPSLHLWPWKDFWTLIT